MKKTLLLYFYLLSMVFIQSCKTTAPTQLADEYITLDTVDIEVNPKLAIYRASETRINDLLHTKLEVSFDWDSTFLLGKANLVFKPFFYDTDSLTLDAKGFQIHEVALVDEIGRRSPLSYKYDQRFLRIDLGETFSRNDTFEVFINYTAMPNKLEEGGSEAISSDKGLYFINPDGSDPDKPKQIWTQGETEASSCWFPTIDSPNEKTTQEIYITVDSSYKTLSNGTLLFQTENPDGTRTDYWKQNLPHAPYLFMMAIGDYAIVEDEWRDIPVNYYVEPKYEAYAKEIFPNSPEMIGFFSKKLGYEYPWDKYHQVVVRDYVSGAMENTGAVIYGEFVQGDNRYLIDNSGEDIVAHELFHHWFGDLVTCESWSNLPLNESFATYGEFLWNEYKYGKDQGDYHIDADLNVYFRSARVNKNSLIRFYYDDRMDMFDAHSYQKGGRVLHMLRTYLGDEAFFAGLQHYLQKHEFKAVEIHDLRIAFEELVGEDLNWFFNQWFLSAGHPILQVEHEYNDSLKKVYLTVRQTQEGEGIPMAFKLPTSVEFVDANGKKTIESIIIKDRLEYFSFDFDKKPLLVNLDAEKTLLADIDQDFSRKEAAILYRKGENYLDRLIAIKELKSAEDSIYLDVIEAAFNDSFWNIRKMAVSGSGKLAKHRPEKTKEIFISFVNKDEKSNVRAAAIDALAKYFLKETSMEVFQKGIKDSSFVVVSSALEAIFEKDKVAGVAAAKDLEKEDNSSLILSISRIYSEDGGAVHESFFTKALNKLSGFNKYPLMVSYADYLEQQNNEVILQALPKIKSIATDESIWWVRMSAVSALIQLQSKFEKELERLNEKDESEITATEKIESAKTEASKMLEEINQHLQALSTTESNENVLRMIESELK